VRQKQAFNQLFESCFTFSSVPVTWPSGFIALATGVTALVLLGRGIVALVSPRLYRAMTPEGSMT